MFDPNQARYATFGVVSAVPGTIIDEIWHIIDTNLQGVLPLENVLNFAFSNRDGKLTITFSEEDTDITIGFDTPYAYASQLPKTVVAYDDGQNQTIILPSEIE
ncbi:DUF960 domain-containing protein [Schleiferilactobacillus shenzhenensis]|nr:DUF960 domain-containing protein [Schleiferilactobacillus shenzhenensis]